MKPEVAVLLYPGCIFFEIALATEILAPKFEVLYYTPDGNSHRASNAASIAAEGSFAALQLTFPEAVIVPGGDPGSILHPVNIARMPLQAIASRGALLAGICAGCLVLAASGLLYDHRGTHNYTEEHAAVEDVRAMAVHWKGMIYERADLVQDRRRITAQPWAYRQFAAAIALELGALTKAQAEEFNEYAIQSRYGGA
jgi:transcriptional regulator GlxA family with amidase domain